MTYVGLLCPCCNRFKARKHKLMSRRMAEITCKKIIQWPEDIKNSPLLDYFQSLVESRNKEIESLMHEISILRRMIK